MTKGTPKFDPRRYELREDPRETLLIAWLDSLPCWDLPGLTLEQEYMLITVESGIDKEHFFVDPVLDDDPDVGWIIERVASDRMLHLAVTNRGRMFLWSIPETDNNQPESARETV
ncbi:MAG: hypothetical protein QF560_06495 [SAR324 cluster bacterium]|mgnify:FL=1|nr:hypothetical protein [SAR324 cluster bacterium]MDP7331825.1 hypothetical protein [SAR324 cluster bacterium]